MYKLCKTEESAVRQRELEKGLLAAMGTQRYEQISVSDLCQQIGIPRKAFYRYFSGKEGALHALIDHTLLEYESYRWDTSRSGAGENHLETFFSFWQGKRDLLDALERSGLSNVLIRQSVSHALTGPAGPSRFRNTYERNNSRVFLVCGLMSVMLQWHRASYPVPAEQMAAAAVCLLNKPLLPEAEALF